MDCSDVQELLSEYLDGMLDSNLNEKIKKHIDACDTCRREYELLKKIVHECNNICDEDLPDGFHEKLCSAISQKAENSRKERLGRVMKYCRMVAAIIVAAVSLGVIARYGILELVGFGSKSTSAVKGSRPNTECSNSVNAVQGSNTGNDVVSINLSSDEYKKNSSDIEAIIKSYGGRIAIEPNVYMMPDSCMDTIVKQLQDKLGPGDIKVSNIESEIQHQVEDRDSTLSNRNSWSMKNNELDVLNNNKGYIIIEIKVTD